MTLRQRGVLTAIGSGGGLLFGLLWYFVWGCDHCARGSSALSPVLFSVLCGACMSNLWGKDHLQRWGG